MLWTLRILMSLNKPYNDYAVLGAHWKTEKENYSFKVSSGVQILKQPLGFIYRIFSQFFVLYSKKYHTIAIIQALSSDSMVWLWNGGDWIPNWEAFGNSLSP